jgi:hypothetical protein
VYWHSGIIIFFSSEIIAENWFNTKEKPRSEDRGKSRLQHLIRKQVVERMLALRQEYRERGFVLINWSTPPPAV